jgi:hypothetical protein
MDHVGLSSLTAMLLAVRSQAQQWIIYLVAFGYGVAFSVLGSAGAGLLSMVVITPQTVSIAIGTALISYVNYRVLLLAIIAVIGECAAYLLARPAPEPAGDAAPVPGAEDSQFTEAPRVCTGTRPAAA